MKLPIKPSLRKSTRIVVSVPSGLVFIVIFGGIMLYKLMMSQLHFWNLLFYFAFVFIGILLIMIDKKATQDDIDKKP